MLLMLLAGAGFAAAQDQDRSSSRADESVPPRASNRAISFSLDGLSLGAVDGGIGGKWWIGRNTALRSSFNFAVNSDEDVTGDEIDSGRSAVSGGLSFIVEWHSAAFGRVSPYLGSGFSVGASASSQTTDYAADNPIRQSRVKASDLDFSVDAALGVEVRLSRHVSLAGEHLIAAHVRTGAIERKNLLAEGPTEQTDQDIRSFTVSTGTSRLIVSIYF